MTSRSIEDFTETAALLCTLTHEIVPLFSKGLYSCILIYTYVNVSTTEILRTYFQVNKQRIVPDKAACFELEP